MRLAILLVAFVLSIVSGMAQDTSLRRVRKAFDSAKVCNDCLIEGKLLRLTYVYKIPDDLTLPFNPKALLEVTFRQPGTLIPPITVHAGVSLPQSGWFLKTGMKLLYRLTIPLLATARPPTYRLLSTPVVPAPRQRPPNSDSQIVIPHTMGDGPFVIVIVDPDAPTPQHPDHAQFRHFLGGGFVLRDLGLVLANKTPAITDFVKPSPPDGSDPHR